MFFLRLPGSGILGGGSGSSSGGLGNHGGFDCPGGFFLPLAPLRLKESSLFLEELSWSHSCSKAFTAVFTSGYRRYSVFNSAEYFLLEIIEINLEILLENNLF